MFNFRREMNDPRNPEIEKPYIINCQLELLSLQRKYVQGKSRRMKS